MLKRKDKQELIESKLADVKRHESGVNYYNEKYLNTLKDIKSQQKILDAYEPGSTEWNKTFARMKDLEYLANSYQKLRNEQHDMAERLKADLSTM